MPEIEPKDTSLKSLTGVHVWHAPLSTCSQRVRIALAETATSYQSHLVNLEKDEHASQSYQSIHPDGLVPALVDNGRLIIESIDIIQHIAGVSYSPDTDSGIDLLKLADDAQADLKLLTFEFLFRSKPTPPAESIDAFQANHQNQWLRQFRNDFIRGFGKDRIDAAVQRTDSGFQTLNQHLSDGREYLGGNTFSVADIAWMPNVHRLQLMDWPFDRTPHLNSWFQRMQSRPSYREALMQWQPDELKRSFAIYTGLRQAQGTDVRAFGPLKS